MYPLEFLLEVKKALVDQIEALKAEGKPIPCCYQRALLVMADAFHMHASSDPN
ncbi:MAG: hypothetical protein ACE5G0_01255 [Rhodothermales bacterium]